MTELFLKLAAMSLTASWLVPAVLILRLLLRKAPKWINCLLWAMVAMRLVCPFSIESRFSLMPESAPLSQNSVSSFLPDVELETSGDGPENRMSDSLGLTVPVSSSITAAQAMSLVWMLGMAAMLLYAFASLLRLRRRLSTAVRLRDNIWQSENAASPFVLGLARPRIYLPFDMPERDMAHVIAHEQAHLRRGDHIAKPFGFLVLTVYWFNPILWLAYALFCRDIELACDESVVKNMDAQRRADYSQALLSCSAPRRRVAPCPLAFGETGVKQRVKNVLGYKKPAAYMVAAAVLVCLTAALCLLTDPAHEPQILVNGVMYEYSGQKTEALPEGSAELGYLKSITHDTKQPPAENLSGTNLDEKYAGCPIYQLQGEPPTVYLKDYGGYYLVFQVTYDTVVQRVTFPASLAEKTEHNEAVFDIEPFTIDFILPDGWSLGACDTTGARYLHSGLWSRVGIFDENGSPVGAVGYNISDAGTVPKELMSVYHQIALGNDYCFDVRNTYKPLLNTGTVHIAEAEVYRSHVLEPGSDTDAINYGILAWDESRAVYAAFELDSGKVTAEQKDIIAASVTFTE